MAKITEPIKGKVGKVVGYETENWNREGNRGASTESIQVGEGTHGGSGKVSWAINKDGRNDDTNQKARVKDGGHSKPTL